MECFCYCIISLRLSISLCLYVGSLCLSVFLCLSTSFPISASLPTNHSASVPSFPFPSKLSLHHRMSLMCGRFDSQSALFCPYYAEAGLLGRDGTQPGCQPGSYVLFPVFFLFCVSGRSSEGDFNECISTQLTRCPHFLHGCRCPDRMF